MRVTGTVVNQAVSDKLLREDYSKKLPVLIDSDNSTPKWNQALLQDLRRHQQRAIHHSIHWSSAPYIVFWDELGEDWHGDYPHHSAK